jgi:hypothetical protein
MFILERTYSLIYKNILRAVNPLKCVWQYENTIFGHLKYKFPYVIASTIFT